MENEKWREAKSKLTDLFTDNEERGKIRGFLLNKPIKERLEYFEGEDNEIKAALETLFPDNIINKSIEDPTVKYMKELLQRPIYTPERNQIRCFLMQEPHVKIPLSRELFSLIPIVGEFSIDKTERDIYFRESNEESCSKFYTELISSLLYPPPRGKTEDSFHAFWDAIISKSLQVFGKYTDGMPSMTFDRNTSKNGKNRPDYILLTRNICIFRGEESGKGNPASELTNKFKTWDHGNVPYLFAYYAQKTIVTFCILYSSEETNKHKRKRQSVFCERIEEFDLNFLSDRIQVMNLIRNMCRVLPILIDTFPPKEHPDFYTIERDNGTVIDIGYYVKKSFTYKKNVQHLVEIYGIMDTHNIRCIDKIVHFENNTVYLEPRGEEKKPKNVNELLKALICILTCLEGLHGIQPNPIMHRDIRWPNIVQLGDNYILIDFDYASSSPSKKALPDLDMVNHAPEMIRGSHDLSVDIWGVGYLIVSSGVRQIPSDLLSLSRLMHSKDKKNRPSASDALKNVKTIFNKLYPSDNWLNNFEMNEKTTSYDNEVN